MATNTPNIVFVLGAGASCEYKLPSGAQLVDEIISDRRDFEVHQRSDYHTHGVNMYMERFRAALKDSGQESVDRFVANRPEYELMAKLAIAANLLDHCEQQTASLTSRRGWYAWLHKQLFPEPGVSRATDVGLVTFNYDQTLEYALNKMIAANSAAGGVSSSDVLAPLNIVHTYGKLDYGDAKANRPILSLWLENRRRLDPTYFCYGAATGLNLIADTRSTATNEGMKRARHLVANAKCLIFMGFGFDETNLRRIGAHISEPEWIRPGRWVYACGYDLTGVARGKVERMLGKNDIDLHLGDPNQLGGDWLRHHIEIEMLLSQIRSE